MQRHSLSSSRTARVLGEVAFVLVVFIIAAAVTNLLIPMPFRIESGHTYTGEQAMEIGQVMRRRFWIGIPVLIVTGLVLEVLRSALRRRFGRARPAAE